MRNAEPVEFRIPRSAFCIQSAGLRENRTRLCQMFFTLAGQVFSLAAHHRHGQVPLVRRDEGRTYGVGRRDGHGRGQPRAARPKDRIVSRSSRPEDADPAEYGGLLRRRSRDPHGTSCTRSSRNRLDQARGDRRSDNAAARQRTNARSRKSSCKRRLYRAAVFHRRSDHGEESCSTPAARR